MCWTSAIAHEFDVHFGDAHEFDDHIDWSSTFELCENSKVNTPFWG